MNSSFIFCHSKETASVLWKTHFFTEYNNCFADCEKTITFASEMDFESESRKT